MDIEGWKKSLQSYEHEKHKAPELPQAMRMTQSNLSKLENSYHPILQVYRDPAVESNLRELEKVKQIETLAKNQDRALRYEQTFNILNLENKLKGLEGLPGYPIEKLPNYKNRKLGNTTNTNYNIVSGLDFADHHFLPPEQRPVKPKEKQITYKINAVEYRDYNIITGRYFQNHEVKSKLDAESYRQEAAKEYWRTHDFDPIKCSYVDNEKEKDYMDRVKEKEKVHGLEQIEKLPHGIKYSEGALYQPIGMKVVDKKRLEEIDIKEKNSKRRFEARYDIERDYRVKDINNQELKKSSTLKRISHDRFLETVNRGYNILSNAPFQGLGAQKVHLPMTTPKDSLWVRTINESEPQLATSKSSRTLRTKGFS